MWILYRQNCAQGARDTDQTEFLPSTRVSLRRRVLPHIRQLLKKKNKKVETLRRLGPARQAGERCAGARAPRPTEPCRAEPDRTGPGRRRAADPGEAVERNHGPAMLSDAERNIIAVLLSVPSADMSA
ncbi:hypothetical protein GN956_G19935 [Arapaima gigas]